MKPVGHKLRLTWEGQGCFDYREFAKAVMTHQPGTDFYAVRGEIRIVKLALRAETESKENETAKEKTGYGNN